MRVTPSRRDFLRAATMAGAGMVFANGPAGAASKKKSVLVFTKSSGWEHEVVKRTGGKPSIVDDAISDLGYENGFQVGVTKDGRIFEDKKLGSFAAVVFFTTGDLTTLGTDGKPPISAKGKRSLLEAVGRGMGFVGIHSASDTFHTQPDPEDLSNRYVAHGVKSDPYLRMLGAEFIVHGKEPRLQTANLIVNDPKFPGLEKVSSPVSFEEEWYSLKDFVPDLHVIMTLETKGMKGECYQRAPYPVTWARQHGRGRVFYTALGDKPESWRNPFFLNVVAGGIRWAFGEDNREILPDLSEMAPGYAEIPPKFPD